MRIKQLIDTEANWIDKDPVLLKGEMAITSPSNKHKVGDGVNTWTQLAYATADLSEVAGKDALEALVASTENDRHKMNSFFVEQHIEGQKYLLGDVLEFDDEADVNTGDTTGRSEQLYYN